MTSPLSSAEWGTRTRPLNFTSIASAGWDRRLDRSTSDEAKLCGGSRGSWSNSNFLPHGSLGSSSELLKHPPLPENIMFCDEKTLLDVEDLLRNLTGVVRDARGDEHRVWLRGSRGSRPQGDREQNSVHHAPVRSFIFLFILARRLKYVCRSDTSEQTNAQSASTSTFVTALVFNAAVFAIEIAVFTIIAPSFRAIYEPRALSPIPSKRVQSIGRRFFLWPWIFFKADFREVERINGSDAYFFLRFLRMMVRILVPIWLISWIVLLPITYIGNYVAGKSGLDKFAYGNVSNSNTPRYWAHLVLVWVFTIWIWYNIKYEMRHFIIKRQQHLVDPLHSASVQANTVLITGIPLRYLTEPALRAMYSHLPGGVKTVWINRDLKELPKLFDRRQSACKKLEGAETKLLRVAAKIRRKKIKKQEKAAKKGQELSEDPAPSDDVETDVSLAAKLVPKKKRPTHRLTPGFMPFGLPFVGKEVDTIDWCTEEIRVTNEGLDEGRRKIRALQAVAPKRGLFAGLEKVPVVGNIAKKATFNDENPFSNSVPSPDPAVDNTNAATATSETELRRQESAQHPIERPSTADSATHAQQDYPPVGSAFLTFNRQISAHLAAQASAHHEPYRMAARHLEVAPEDVIWGNLGLNPYEAKLRMLVSWAATVGLIIVWAIPVAFIGIVSNVHSLCATYKWLAWLCKLPSVVVGIISGILPPVLLAVLMMFLPIILRLMARFEGIPQRTGLELSLMNRYFSFLVIHSFLIVTISSGIIAALPGLVKNPTGIPSLLANKLPQASTFFLTYIILQGLSGAASGFLQVVTLILYYVKLVLLGSTPRSIYNIKYGPRTVAWGTLFPAITLLVVITFGYSIISPIINGLACFTFFLFYLLYKYLFTWVLEQPASSDTGGLFFPKAIQHLFVGLYIQQICLCALFFLAQDENHHQAAIPEGALMVVLIIFTICYHMLINNSYGPLIHFLPVSLAERTWAAHTVDTENQPLIGATGPGPDNSKDFAAQNQGEKTDSDARAPKGTSIDQGDGTTPPYQSEEHDGMPREREAGADAHEYGFAQPAASRPQPTVWFPEDALGLGKEQEAALRAAGVDASTEDALMDAKGKVTISAPPPGYERGN